jgi:hypothetical protein
MEEENSLERWGYGLAAPLVAIGYGILCIARQEIALGRAGGRYTLFGGVAVAAGLATLCGGAGLHFYFWYRDRDEDRFRRLHFVGTGLSVGIGAIALIVFLILLSGRVTP